MKRVFAILLSICLLASLAAPALAAPIKTSGAASTLKLESVDGTAQLKNASGKEVKTTKGTRLYNGYKLATEKASYAFVSLDDTKAIKLDASSSSEVFQSGKKLELEVTSGQMFFNVTAPLKSDESLTIRTSTMVTGVRGTSGWISVIDRFTTQISLLEGELTITSTDPLTGVQRTITIVGGQTATIVYHGKDKNFESEIVIEDKTIRELIDDGTISDEHIIITDTGLTVETLQEEDVPGFVAVEVKKDKELQKKIEENSPLSVPAIIGNAEERLEKEEAAAEAADKAIQEEFEKLTADDVDPLFKSETPSSGGGASNENVTPVQYNFAVVSNFYDASGSEPLEANELQGHAAAGSVQTITVPEGYELVQLIVNDTIVDEITTPPTVVVNSDTVVSATFYSTTIIYLENPVVTTVNTALGTYDELYITGTVSTDTTDTILVEAGKTIHFIGTDSVQNDVTVPASTLGNGVVLSTFTDSSVIVEEGTLLNNGDILGDGTMTVLPGATLDNNGTIQIGSPNSLHIQGALINNYVIDVGLTNAPGLLALEKGTFTNNGTLTISALGSVTTAANTTLFNGANGIITNNGTFSVASGATMNNAGSLNTGTGSLTPDNAGFSCEGTYNDTRTGDLMATIKDGSAIIWVGAASTLPDTVPAGLEIQLFGAPSGTMTNINSSSFTLDLNGRQVGNLLTVNRGFIVTLKDSSKVNSGAFTNRVSNNGTLIVESGTITATSGVALTNYGTLTVSGGSIGDQNCSYGIQNLDERATVSVSGNAAVYGSSAGIYTQNAGLTTISGGTVSGSSGIHVSGSSVTITGGTISGDNYGIYDSSTGLASTITMTGGEIIATGGENVCGIFTGGDGKYVSTDESGNPVYDAGTTIEVTGGTIRATGTIEGIGISNNYGSIPASVTVYGTLYNSTTNATTITKSANQPDIVSGNTIAISMEMAN